MGKGERAPPCLSARNVQGTSVVPLSGFGFFFPSAQSIAAES